MASSDIEHIRHSLAHLLAAAIMELYPDAKRTIGPAIDNGFYFDFEFPTDKPSEKDFPRIEEKMRSILPTWTNFERFELSADEAKAEYPGNPYKHELIDEFTQSGEKVSFYKSGNYWDLCKGGHMENPAAEINAGAFALERIAGAYWKGDEKNTMLTRIYGLAFRTEAELESYRLQQEEALKRDHKKLGRELDLFYFSNTVGKGLPLFTPRGSIIRRELERFIVDEEIKRGYLHVYTPDIAKLDLYKKSGHYPHYKDSMYAPIEVDGEEFMLRPMTCPHHFELYLRGPHSYRELPMRIAELAQLYRYEQSGELSGLLRVRSFCLADAHIICAGEEQAVEEVSGALDLIEHLATVFGLTRGTDYSYRLSLGSRDNTDKYYKNDAAWDTSEELLRAMLIKRGCPFVEAEDEAAFYGPKIDVQMRNVNGKEDTAFTVQYDFCMPERFDLTYIAEDGSEQRALVVHRSSIGAIERTMAFLIERYAGAFPLWLAPLQVSILPVSDKHEAYANEVCAQFIAQDIRASVDTSNESLGKKIRNGKIMKVPYLLIVGDKEAAAHTVSVEARDGDIEDSHPIDAIVERLRLKKETRSL